jgi:hypothetical protein
MVPGVNQCRAGADQNTGAIYMRHIRKTPPKCKSSNGGGNLSFALGHTYGEVSQRLLYRDTDFLSLSAACQLDPRGPGGEIDARAP